MKGISSFVNQVNEGILAILANKNGKMGGLLNNACKLHTYMYVQIIINHNKIHYRNDTKKIFKNMPWI